MKQTSMQKIYTIYLSQN